MSQHWPSNSSVSHMPSSLAPSRHLTHPTLLPSFPLHLSSHWLSNLLVSIHSSLLYSHRYCHIHLLTGVLLCTYPQIIFIYRFWLGNLVPMARGRKFSICFDNSIHRGPAQRAKSDRMFSMRSAHTSCYSVLIPRKTTRGEGAVWSAPS